MFLEGIQFYFAVFLLVERICIHAEELSPNNKVAVSNSVTGYFDFADVGVANFAPERLGNLRSNYPPRSLLPFGNQVTDYVKQRNNQEVNFNRENKDKSVSKERLFQLDLPNNEMNYRHDTNKKSNGITRSVIENQYIGELDDQNLKVQLGKEFTKIKQYLAQGIRKSQEETNRVIFYDNFKTTARDIEDSANLPIPKIQYTNELDPLLYKPNLPKKYYLNTEKPFVSEPIVNLPYQDIKSAYHKRPFVNQNSDSRNEDESKLNSKTAILGKPVVIPHETTTTTYHNFEESTTEAIQKQCVQDCETTSQYDPVCGSDYITYFNPMKFECARKCGIDVHVVMKGRCE